jgi:hypothetical protein
MAAATGRRLLYALLAPVAVLGSCVTLEVGFAIAADTPDEDPAADWRPNTLGRCELELRPLPPARALLADYERWVQEPRETKTAKHYTVAVMGSRQHALTQVRHLGLGGSTLGVPPFTRATFKYVDPELGTYRFEWEIYGWHWPRFLRVARGSRRFIVAPIDQPPGTIPPMLLIHGIEGIESHMEARTCTPRSATR